MTLQLLVDPVKTKARLDELIAAEVAAQDKIDTLNAMDADTRRLHSTAVATNIVADNRMKALDVREAEDDAREARLEQLENTKSAAAMSRRESAAAAQENAVARREAAVAKREAAVDAREAKIKAALS